MECPTFWFILGQLSFSLLSVPSQHPVVTVLLLSQCSCKEGCVANILRLPGSFSSLILGEPKNEGGDKSLVEWVICGLWFLDEKPRFGAYSGGTHVPWLTTERRARCLLTAGKLWLPSGSDISLIFSASPLPWCSSSAPAFPCPLLSAASSPQLLEPSDWRLPAAGPAGFMALRPLGRKRGQRPKMETHQEIEYDERVKERETKTEAEGPRE